MRKVCLFGLISFVVIFSGCGVKPDKIRTREQKLTAITAPYINRSEIEVVGLVFNDRHNATGYGFRKFIESEIFAAIWEGYPTKNIPEELIGQRVNKKVEITYKVISNSHPPFVQILEFQIKD